MVSHSNFLRPVEFFILAQGKSGIALANPF